MYFIPKSHNSILRIHKDSASKRKKTGLLKMWNGMKFSNKIWIENLMLWNCNYFFCCSALPLLSCCFVIVDIASLYRGLMMSFHRNTHLRFSIARSTISLLLDFLLLVTQKDILLLHELYHQTWSNESSNFQSFFFPFACCTFSCSVSPPSDMQQHSRIN